MMLSKGMRLVLLAMGLLLSLSVMAAGANVLAPIFHNNNDPVAGNKDGKITVVEFFDYKCAHCVNMAPTIANIIKNNPDVRVIFKEYPIMPGNISQVAARAALAANLQGKYYPFHHALLTSDEPLSMGVILKIAKKQGLNVDKLKKDMNSPAVTKTLQANLDLGKTLGVAGTPALFIGKTDATDTKEVKFELGEMDQDLLQSEIVKLR